jgi:hypothetical protein
MRRNMGATWFLNNTFSLKIAPWEARLALETAMGDMEGAINILLQQALEKHGHEGVTGLARRSDELSRAADQGSHEA